MNTAATEMRPTTQPALRIVTAAPNPNWRRAGLLRLILAELTDRILPLPFLAFFFPAWTLVVLAWHLLCDCGPNRRSAGKWIFRLRVVARERRSTCAWWQAALQRLGIALAQAAWCAWAGLPYLIVYELASLAFLLLSPTGRRLEEYLAGTVVVTEKSFRQQRQGGIK
ncbi:MAG: RDD family protein [Blastocatellia bacterium]|nr:RDD family protein [Blastocatellia bacterium]